MDKTEKRTGNGVNVRVFFFSRINHYALCLSCQSNTERFCLQTTKGGLLVPKMALSVFL